MQILSVLSRKVLPLSDTYAGLSDGHTSIGIACELLRAALGRFLLRGRSG